MKPALLDVNMLIALAWPSHQHHRTAHKWFAKYSSAGWATCPFTQCGFVRISSNPHILTDAVTPQEAIELLRKMTLLKTHIFWGDEISFLDAIEPLYPLGGHRQITDAYLLGLAISKGGVLVSFDRNIASLLPATSPHKKSLCIVG